MKESRSGDKILYDIVGLGGVVYTVDEVQHAINIQKALLAKGETKVVIRTQGTYAGLDRATKQNKLKS